MVSNTSDQTEEAMAPTPEPTGDEKKMPSFDEVVDPSPIPAPPASPSPASEDASVPPIPDALPTPAPVVAPAIAPATQAPAVNPGFVEAVVAPAVDAVAEATDAASAQPIPESLTEVDVKPVSNEATDAAEVPATAFPVAPTPPKSTASGYEREGAAFQTDFPHPEPLTDAPSTHQIPRIQPLAPKPPASAKIPDGTHAPADATAVIPPITAAVAAQAAAQAEQQAAEAAPTSSDEKKTAESSDHLIDPTRPALIFGAIVFLFGAIWGPWMATRPVTDLNLAQSLREATTQVQSDNTPAPNLTTTPPPAPSVTPVISSVQVLSWNNDDGDHPDRAINMIDSNPSTSWSSRWFDNNQFRDDTSVTIVVKLQQKATVSSVTLHMDSATSGGELVVRNVTDPTKPREGTELATSSLSPTTTITLPQPVETDSIALQFRSMPKGQDGRNWAWISELTVQ